LSFILAMAAAAAPLSEVRATDLVFDALHQLYPKERECFSLLTEERSRAAYDIAVYEKHNHRCGGDPQIMHIRNRFRIGRSPVRLWIEDIEGNLRACRLSRGGRPQCPRL
jgi:hypothetical protein